MTDGPIETLDAARRYAETVVLKRALDQTAGSIPDTARILQCSRVKVYDLMRRCDIEDYARSLREAAHKKGKAYRPRDAAVIPD